MRAGNDGKRRVCEEEKVNWVKRLRDLPHCCLTGLWATEYAYLRRTCFCRARRAIWEDRNKDGRAGRQWKPPKLTDEH